MARREPAYFVRSNERETNAKIGKIPCGKGYRPHSSSPLHELIESALFWTFVPDTLVYKTTNEPEYLQNCSPHCVVGNLDVDDHKGESSVGEENVRKIVHLCSGWTQTW